MLKTYREQVAERAALGIPPLPLTSAQTESLIGLLKAPPAGEEAFLMELLTHRVPAGVDDAGELACVADDVDQELAVLKVGGNILGAGHLLALSSNFPSWLVVFEEFFL